MEMRLSLRQNKSLICLTGILLLIICLGVSEGGYASGMESVIWVGLGAFVIGLLISRSMLPWLVAHVFSIVIGSGWTFWIMTNRSPEDYTWLERWTDLTNLIVEFTQVAISGGTFQDNTIFIFQMSLFCWLVGYLTIWFLFRIGRAWWAIVPGSLFLAINLYFAQEDITFWFVCFIFFAFLIIIRFTLTERETEWRVHQVHFRSDISFDFVRDGLIFSIVVIALAWLTPTLSHASTLQMFRAFDREWRDVQGEWRRLFAGVNYRPDPSNIADFSQELTLSGARRLNNEPVMFVYAPGGRYWRAAVYDEYTGQGWKSNDEVALDVDVGDVSLNTPRFSARQPLTQTYTIFQENRAVLFVMNDVSFVNRDVRVKTSQVDAQKAGDTAVDYWSLNEPFLQDVTYIESDIRLQAHETYGVISYVSDASIEDLQEDHTRYPAWISERYLQLPEDIPQRVFDLAEDITFDKTSSFDKAVAIERYLRRELEYNEQIQAPPENRDKVDYILFDLKQAYCDYYATSMLVMLRSLGIPSRLAAGYSQGSTETLENEEEMYLVRSKDAHSWVEVFFPTYGWLEFEPTAAQPTIPRVSRPDDDEIDNLPANLPPAPPQEDYEDLFNIQDDGGLDFIDIPQSRGLFSFTLPLFGQIEIYGSTLTCLFVLGLIGGGGYLYFQRQNRRQSRSQVQESYQSLLQLSRWLGYPKRETQTPYEHANGLSQTLPRVKPHINFIAQEYVRHEFSRSVTATATTRMRIGDSWRSIKPAFYRAFLVKLNPLRRKRAG